MRKGHNSEKIAVRAEVKDAKTSFRRHQTEASQIPAKQWTFHPDTERFDWTAVQIIPIPHFRLEPCCSSGLWTKQGLDQTENSTRILEMEEIFGMLNWSNNVRLSSALDRLLCAAHT